MKCFAIALLACAAALSAHSARADTRIHLGVHVDAPAYCPPPVVAYAPAPTVIYAPPAHGYWEEVVVKTWVPERWFTTRDQCGRLVRVREPGHFAYRTERVWVEPPVHHRPHGPAYGYHGHRGPWHR